jgi:hypothetical protein
MGRERVYNAGFVTAFYKGRPVVPMDSYPNDVMDFVDTRGLKGMFLRKFEMKGPFEMDDLTRWAFIAEAIFWVENRRKQFARLDALN